MMETRHGQGPYIFFWPIERKLNIDFYTYYNTALSAAILCTVICVNIITMTLKSVIRFVLLERKANLKSWETAIKNSCCGVT